MKSQVAFAAMLCVSLGLAGSAGAGPAAATRPELAVIDAAGQRIPLIDEELTGLESRPLLSTKKELTQQFGPGFISFQKVKAKAGDKLTGTYQVPTGSWRLTVYHISKEKNGPRYLRVVATGYHAVPEPAKFSTTIERLEENVFLVTAEAVKSADDLNSHLRYMNAQNNEIVLKGYGTNWNLSALKFKLSGKEEKATSGEFVKEADWLVQRLTKPQWVMSVRVETD